MTPEERFVKIENVLQGMMEHHARQQGQNERHDAGIRDLIVVSRTVLTSIQELQGSIQELHDVQRKDHEEWSTQMKELRDAQATTDERLNILIDTVERIIRRRESPE